MRLFGQTIPMMLINIWLAFFLLVGVIIIFYNYYPPKDIISFKPLNEITPTTLIAGSDSADEMFCFREDFFYAIKDMKKLGIAYLNDGMPCFVYLNHDSIFLYHLSRHRIWLLKENSVIAREIRELYERSIHSESQVSALIKSSSAE